MNIIEAIKSGKPYRRKNIFDISSKMKIFFTPGDERDFSYSEVLSDDWEVEQTSVTITLDEFASAFATALDSFKKMELTMNDFYLKLTKELGL